MFVLFRSVRGSSNEPARRLQLADRCAQGERRDTHVELALQALDDDPATQAEIETYQAAADKRREYARTRAVQWRAKKKAQTKEDNQSP